MQILPCSATLPSMELAEPPRDSSAAAITGNLLPGQMFAALQLLYLHPVKGTLSRSRASNLTYLEVTKLL